MDLCKLEKTALKLEFYENKSSTFKNKTARTSAVALMSTSHDKLSNNDHGNRFQSKLLFIFFMRAINKGYKFHLHSSD